MTRMPSFCKLKMLRHAQIQIVVSKVFQKTAVPFSFYRRKRYTKFLLNQNVFSPKKGGGPGGPTQAQSACPHFLEKILLKKLLCIVCVCKKWHCRFFEAFDLPHYESVRVWAFLVCKKIEIRVMWTFTASKKENPCSFLRVRSSAEKLHSFSEVFLSCGNIKDLLKAIQLIIGYPYHTKIVKNY